MTKLTVHTLALLLLAGTTFAQEKKPEYVTLKSAKVEGVAMPGGRVNALLVFSIKEGFHTQSHKPSEEYFIPTELKFELPTGVRIGEIIYPKGHEEKVVGLDKPLSVYDNEFEIKVPIAISARAELPASLKGSLNYQACQGAVCYPPQTLEVTVSLATPST